MIGAAMIKAAAPNTITAPRQPTQPIRAWALGKETVPARPATRATRVIAFRASLPMLRVRIAKQASYRDPAIARPIKIQIR